MKKEQQTVVLGQPITMEQFIAVCRFGAQVEFSDDYCQRVRKSRQLVERWVDEGKVMYGVTTGFGSLCTKAISKEEFLMQGLISYLPNCRHMKMTEKLSAARWAMMPAESLCPAK